MRTGFWVIALACAAALGGCTTTRPRAAKAATSVTLDVRPNEWRQIASLPDAARIDAIGNSWAAALAEVRTRGGSASLAKEGALLDPAIALPRPAPPPGVYRCRLIRLLVAKPGRRAKTMTAFKPSYCYVSVEGPLLIFSKGTGAQQPGGRLWEDSDTRLIFLGAVAARPGGAVPAYAADPTTNQVGIVERIGEFRWRMVIADPAPDARLDVIDLVPDVRTPIEPATR